MARARIGRRENLLAYYGKGPWAKYRFTRRQLDNPVFMKRFMALPESEKMGDPGRFMRQVELKFPSMEIPSVQRFRQRARQRSGGGLGTRSQTLLSKGRGLG